MTNANFALNLKASEIFRILDAKDGNSNKNINAKEWNTFANIVGGKEIQYSINEDRALKSINYYLNKISNETKKTVAEFLGAELQNTQVKENNTVAEKKPTEINIDNKNSLEIFNELDAQDGNVDQVIKAKEWNNFAQKVGGKSIQKDISKDRALKSINFYLNRIATAEKTKIAKTNTPTIKTTQEPTPKTIPTTVIQKSLAEKTKPSQEVFNKNTILLNQQVFEHNSHLLEVAQDSLGLYEITAYEYEIMKKENPEELKNTQSKIVGDYGMRNGHQWCAYTVGYLAKEAGMNMPQLSTVQAYIDKYINDYNKIQTKQMTINNFQEERSSRAEQIKTQLPKMNEGDFIIWKGDFVVPLENNSVQKSKASHIGIIEHVNLEDGIVTVIEGNANVNDMDENNERKPVTTRQEGKKGAQIIGEYQEVNERDGLIRKQYTIEELAKHGYTGFIDNSSRLI